VHVSRAVRRLPALRELHLEVRRAAPPAPARARATRRRLLIITSFILLRVLIDQEPGVLKLYKISEPFRDQTLFG